MKRKNGLSQKEAVVTVCVVNKVTALVLLTASISLIGCGGVITVDEIRTVTPDEVQGQTGYLVQVKFEKENVAPADKVFSRAILLIRDNDISWYNFYLDIEVITEKNDLQAVEILQLFSLLEQAEGLSVIGYPPDEEIAPLWILGTGVIRAELLCGLIIDTPADNVLLKMNLAIKEDVMAMFEKALRDGPKVIDFNQTPTEPPTEPTEPPVEPPPTEPPTTIVEEQVRDQLRAWDEEVERDIHRILPPPLNTEQAIRGLVVHGIFSDIFVDEFGFAFKEVILVDLINLIMQEQPALAAQIRQQGLILHPLSRNGLLYEYLRIQYAYPDASGEEHFAHFRQSVRNGNVQINRDEPTDIVPLGQEVILESEFFQWNSFLTPVEKVEQALMAVDRQVPEALMEHPGITTLAWVETMVSGITDTTVYFIITDLFYYYRLEQPAQAALIEQRGIIVHPISKNGMLYEWLLLRYQYPDKAMYERVILFREAARRGEIIVNKPVGLTTIIPPEDELFLPPSLESHTSPAERRALSRLSHYDQSVVNNGGSRENPFIVFLFSDSNDVSNPFITHFNIRIEFVFNTLWNIYKTEQPALAAQLEPGGLIIHPISRNGLLYEWLRIRYEYPGSTQGEWLTMFRQSAQQGSIQVNRDGPTDVVSLEGAVRIRPPGANELVHQGLVLP